MSDKLQIHFNSDMPSATVEIVAPNLEIVQRVWLRPGGYTQVDVPSENSFLRVHLPSGRVVTLHDPGNLDRQINLNSLEQNGGRRSQLNFRKTYSNFATVEVTDTHPRLAVQLHRMNGELIPGFQETAIDIVRLANIRSLKEPLYLEVIHEGRILTLNLPGLLSGVITRVIQLESGLRLVSIQVRTVNPEADTLGGYIARGDLNSAAAMYTWASNAEELLYSKMDDPYAAALGAYLLLRLRRFDLMRTWTRNLADRFPKLADGSVIWAWQQIYQRGDEKTIREYLFKAASTGSLPVFTEGLKLLGNGLRLLGPEGLELKRELEKETGRVLWESPFTASVISAYSPEKQVKFEIGFDSEW